MVLYTPSRAPVSAGGQGQSCQCRPQFEILQCYPMSGRRSQTPRILYQVTAKDYPSQRLSQPFLLTYFKELALRRVHCFDLTSHDAKKGMIEKSCIFINEKPPSCSDRSWAVLIGMIEAVGAEMWLIKLPPAVPFVSQKLPQPSSIFDATSPSTSCR